MAEASEQSAKTASKAKSAAENVKETLESIVVAFILAFVFRAFVVEAFVIPTGSMAATLYGEQLTKTCSMCGYQYALGITGQVANEARGQPSYGSIRLRCPNCGMQRDEVRVPQISRPNSGDRILVHKWPFDLIDVGNKWLGPQRWDITVFKDPRDGETNFIKRLVGLPGEVLEIIDGDVYTASIDLLTDNDPGLIRELEQLRREVYEYGFGQSSRRPQPEHFLHRYAQLSKRLLPYLQIRRKTARAQESLWFNVYNHDFLPNYDSLREDQLPARVGWRPQADAWDTTTREIRFHSLEDVPLFIEFSGKPIGDFYAYNNDAAGQRRPRPWFPVGDLRLRFTWFPDAGSGGLTLEMNRDRHLFRAELDQDGAVRLEMEHPDLGSPGPRQTIGQRQLEPFARGRAVHVEFINVDYRVCLLVNREEVAASTDQQYRPGLEKLIRLARPSAGPQDLADLVKRSTVRIGARNLVCRIRHLLLERDVYYRSQQLSHEPDNRPNPYHDWPGWGTAGHPILLRPNRHQDGKRYFGEYYMLGDNSPASKDSRLWWEIGPHLRPLGQEYQLGTVPEDQLIGKAFFVYWPAGYRRTWAAGIGLIPNFGRMRWIR